MGLIFVGLFLVASAACMTLMRLRRRRHASAAPADIPAAVPAASRCGSLIPEPTESAVVGQLLLGAISQAEYRSAVERLAAADALAHPVRLPLT